jgi:SsrA-binding protein
MAQPAAKQRPIQNIAENRKARHDYFIEESYEAGIALQGTEVKSCRLGRVNLRDGYAQVEGGEIYLHNVHISPYEQGNRFNHDPLRKRKLLMHKREIMKLLGAVREKGYTLVPLRLYFNEKGKVKVELGLARGKKSYDKRADIAARDAQRQIARALRGRDRDDD